MEMTAEIQRLTHIAKGDKEMVDYYPLRYNHKEPEPAQEEREDQEEQQPVVVEAVYNYHEDGKSKTVALTISLQLPQLQS
jgi:hypothetical protein